MPGIEKRSISRRLALALYFIYEIRNTIAESRVVSLNLNCLTSLYQRFPQVKNLNVDVCYQSRDTEKEVEISLSKFSVDARYPERIAIKSRLISNLM